MTDQPWYTDHGNIIILTEWMADNDYDARDLAYAVEKPWKYEDEFNQAKAALAADTTTPAPKEPTS